MIFNPIPATPDDGKRLRRSRRRRKMYLVFATFLLNEIIFILPFTYHSSRSHYIHLRSLCCCHSRPDSRYGSPCCDEKPNMMLRRIPGSRNPGCRILGFRNPGCHILGFRSLGYRILGSRNPGYRSRMTCGHRIRDRLG